MESDNTKVDLDQEIIKRLRKRIYVAERENYKTKKYKNNEMNDKIRKIIQFEVDKSDY